MTAYPEDQARLLDEASAIVKEQAHYLKRAIQDANTRDALKHASNMICELRTSLLSPKNYYELYMQVFQEMQHLHGYFGDKALHGRKMVDLYESVQHAGNILPRLYLLATVGSAYIKTGDAPAKDILKDVSELCKGVQHPLRGLFLRYYLSQMMKNKLPDIGSGYEGEGGTMDDAFEFVFSNFEESNRLWVRMQHQGPAKDRAKREKERHDLRVLVGANLVRLSQLEGMTAEYYSRTALPKVLDHITTVKDVMSQQYLFESVILVFPDEFHILTLEQLLMAYAKAHPSVDMQPIVVALMNRLSKFLTDPEAGAQAIATNDVFTLFRTHLSAIIERTLPSSGNSRSSTANPNGAASDGTADLKPCLEIQAAFMNFTNTLYPGNIHYVDLILGSMAELLRSNCTIGSLGGESGSKVVDLLCGPLKTLSLSVLDMEHYPTLLEFLDFGCRKQVAQAMVTIITEDNHALSSLDGVNSLFRFISALVRDEQDTPAREDKETVEREQQLVAKLPHQIRNDDVDECFQMVTAVRGFFGQGGPKRLVYTLPSVFFAAMSLLPRIRAIEAMRAEGEEVPLPTLTAKKIFQFMHKTVTALQQTSAEVALNLWLIAAGAADNADRASSSPGAFEAICYEFLTQAMMCFEDEITETSKQFTLIFTMVGTLTQIACLEPENYDALSQKMTQKGARLLKKQLQCRAVAACSHLFWCEAKREGKRVLECLQKCLKITDTHVQSDPSAAGLWVEMLDKYIYYYEVDVEEVQIGFIQSLMNLCEEHVSFAEKEGGSAEAGAKARAHLKETVGYLRNCKNSGDAAVSVRFAELELP